MPLHPPPPHTHTHTLMHTHALHCLSGLRYPVIRGVRFLAVLYEVPWDLLSQVPHRILAVAEPDGLLRH